MPVTQNVARQWPEELHWLRRESVPSTERGGRPTVQYHVNPAVVRK